MPIRPENKSRYPKDWPAISAAVRREAGNKCEECGVENYARGGGSYLSRSVFRISGSSHSLASLRKLNLCNAQDKPTIYRLIHCKGCDRSACFGNRDVKRIDLLSDDDAISLAINGHRGMTNQSCRLLRLHW